MPIDSVLAVDVGSSGIRASLYDVELGAVVGSVDAALPRSTGQPGGLDADACWVAVAGAIRALLTRAAAQPIAVGITSQLGMVLVDADGNPLAPAMLWSDTSARDHVESASAVLGDRVHRIGRNASVELGLTRLLMLAADEPELLDRSGGLVSLKDFLVERLTGERATDPTHASYTGFYDVSTGEWIAGLVEDLHLSPSLLPPVAAAWDQAGTVRRSASLETGIRLGVPVAVGGPDGSVGAYGAGGGVAGSTVNVAGSSDVIVHVTGEPVFGLGVGAITNAFIGTRRWSVGGSTGTTGAFLVWLARLLGFEDVTEMHASLEPFSDVALRESRGLRVDPALTGHRFPFWRPGARASISGATASTDAAAVLSAAHQACAYTLHAGFDALEALGMPMQEVVVVGGSARNPGVLQLRADVWQRTVIGVAAGDATSRGAATLAALAADAIDAARSPFQLSGERYEPRQGSWTDRSLEWRQSLIE